MEQNDGQFSMSLWFVVSWTDPEGIEYYSEGVYPREWLSNVWESPRDDVTIYLCILMSVVFWVDGLGMSPFQGCLARLSGPGG